MKASAACPCAGAPWRASSRLSVKRLTVRSASAACFSDSPSTSRSCLCASSNSRTSRPAMCRACSRQMSASESDRLGGEESAELLGQGGIELAGVLVPHRVADRVITGLVRRHELQRPAQDLGAFFPRVLVAHCCSYPPLTRRVLHNGNTPGRGERESHRGNPDEDAAEAARSDRARAAGRDHSQEPPGRGASDSPVRPAAARRSRSSAGPFRRRARA